MKKLTTFIICLIACCAFVFTQCSENKTTGTATSKDTVYVETKPYGGYENQQKWGEHLVSSIGCGDCHTPKKMGPMGPEPDSSLLLSGHPAQMPVPDVDRKGMESKGLAVTSDLTSWVGPWGVSYASNITSDSSGIGMWNENQFLYCIRNGKQKGFPGSRMLLPPMPGSL